MPVVFVVVPSSGAGASRPAPSPEPEDAWSGCVDEEIHRRELQRAPSGSVDEATAAVVQACRSLYRGQPGHDERAIHATINGIRAQTTLPVVIKRGG